MPRRPASEEVRRVYREHVDAVYAYFAYNVGRDAAEDLTASTFERVVRSWRRYDPSRSAERTWILAIARNLLIDHFRREGRRNELSSDEHPAVVESIGGDDPEIERRIVGEEVQGWLASLKPRDREVVSLRYGADLATGEIAQQLGLSEANVHQIISRSLRRLREAAEADLSDSA